MNHFSGFVDEMIQLRVNLHFNLFRTQISTSDEGCTFTSSPQSQSLIKKLSMNESLWDWKKFVKIAKDESSYNNERWRQNGNQGPAKKDVGEREICRHLKIESAFFSKIFESSITKSEITINLSLKFKTNE